MPIKSIELFNIIRKNKFKEPEFDTINGKKVIKKLVAYDNKNQPVLLGTNFGTKYSIHPNYATEIFMKGEHTPVAFNTFWISEDYNTINGGMMSVNDYSKRGNGYGELLRLASIIDLQENYLDRISIFALSEAIPFHHKYKFKPCIPFQKDSSEDLLLKISNKQEPKLSALKNSAINLLENIQNAGFMIDTNTHNKFTKSINKLIAEYIETVKFEKLAWQSTPEKVGSSFDTDIEMVLDIDTVFCHKDFFNEKFQKHGIDYEI